MANSPSGFVYRLVGDEVVIRHRDASAGRRWWAVVLLVVGAGCTGPQAVGDLPGPAAQAVSPGRTTAPSPTVLTDRAPLAAPSPPSPGVTATPPRPDASPASSPPAAPTSSPPSPAATFAPEAPVAADHPAGLAAQLAAAHGVIRDVRSKPEDLAAAGHLQQVAVGRLARSPEWLDLVLAALPAERHADVQANLGASLEFRALQGYPPTTLPSWRIVAPPPAEVLRATYAEAEAASGVPWAYLAAIHLVETRMSRLAGDSVAGAQGPMQFIPETWARYGQGDVRDTRQAILAAGRYLAASGAPADLDRALYAYNNSQRYVRAVRAYAERMLADERAFLGYYHWQVYFAQPGGAVWLREGYDGAAPS